MLGQAPRLNKNPVSAAGDSIIRLTGRHFPTKRSYEGAGAKKKCKSKERRACRARKERSASGHPGETTRVCSACSSEPGLCVDKGCFEAYHTKLDYSLLLQ